MKVRLSARSKADLEEIGEYIAIDSPMGAVAFVRKLRAACAKIGNMPSAYRARSELLDGLRSSALKSYIIFFVVREDEVFVLRILHSARDIGPADFDPEGNA